MSRDRTLNASASLTEALLLYRVRFGVTSPPSLEEEDVRAVEREVGRLPDELVTYFAATGQDTRQISALTIAAQEQGLPHGYAVFARGEGHLVCTPTGNERGKIEVGRWTVDDEEPYLDQSLAHHLRQRFDLARPTPAEREAVEAARPSFAPALRRPAPPAPRHVTHPKFGDGVVVQEIRDGNHKLVIDFACGRKTLIARFVSDRAPVAAA